VRARKLTGVVECWMEPDSNALLIAPAAVSGQPCLAIPLDDDSRLRWLRVLLADDDCDQDLPGQFSIVGDEP
jgi:hypothetical protein